MKMRFQRWSPGLGLMILGTALGVPPEVVPADAMPSESVLQKTTRLIREDAARAAAQGPADAATVAKSAGPDLALLPSPGEPLVFDPMVVHRKQVPEIPPAVHESPVTEVLRTGTFWQKIGPRFTTRLWASGDKGLMLTLAW